ncbi:MAG TPA: ferritin-like domain-containing protein, partial [Burkholderiaceae bacterium]
MKKAANLTQCPSWTITDIPFQNIDKSAVRDDEFLFLTLASASFVEILSETFSNNLVEHFRDDRDIVDWLTRCWQREEVQHGQALRTYVQAVWPEFDWHLAYEGFRNQYAAICTVEQLEPNRALELMARCVVETGTSSFYRALQQYASEPVLRELLGHI